VETRILGCVLCGGIATYVLVGLDPMSRVVEQQRGPRPGHEWVGVSLLAFVFAVMFAGLAASAGRWGAETLGAPEDFGIAFGWAAYLALVAYLWLRQKREADGYTSWSQPYREAEPCPGCKDPGQLFVRGTEGSAPGLVRRACVKCGSHLPAFWTTKST
jgi:hypothetical protein